jgi:regulatory protein
MASGGDDRQAARAGQGRQRRRALKAPDEPALQAAALSYLGRFAASTEMLRRVLLRRVERAAREELIERDHGRQMVERVIARIVSSGLLDDETFAVQRARSLVRRGKAPSMVKSALAAKGIWSDGAAHALSELGEEMPDIGRAAALNLARRRHLGPYRKTARSEHRDRDLATLARAGHPFEIARWIVDAADIEALEQEER